MGKSLFWICLFITLQASAQQLFDPTKPQGFIAGTGLSTDSADTADSAIIVSAVFIKNGSKSAVINGESVAEGQSWKGNRVKTIHKNGVVLDIQGRETELFINQYSIKKDASNDF